jgi:hypothetical protein
MKMDEKFYDELRKNHKQMLIITTGIISGYLIYIYLALNISKLSQVPAAAEASYEQYAVFIICAAAAVFISLTVLFTKFMLSDRGKSYTQPQESGNLIYINRIKTLTIIRLFLCESIVFPGLVLTILTQKPFYTYVSAGISFAAMIVFFPRYAKWEEWASRMING